MNSVVALGLSEGDQETWSVDLRHPSWRPSFLWPVLKRTGVEHAPPRIRTWILSLLCSFHFLLQHDWLKQETFPASHESILQNMKVWLTHGKTRYQGFMAHLIYLKSIYLSSSFAKIGLKCTENRPQMYRKSASNVQKIGLKCTAVWLAQTDHMKK